MLWRTAAWTLAVLLGTATASAVPATPDGAQAVKGQLERFLGRGPVAVTPDHDAYRIAIDLKAALKGLERFGITLDPVTYEMTATPLDNGTWRVTSGNLPLISVKSPDQTTSVAVNGQSFDGIFDPRVPFFTTWKNSYDSLSVGTVGTSPDVGAVQTRQLEHGHQELAATSAADGIADAKLTQGNASYAQEITIDSARGALRIALKGGPTTDALTIERLPIRALLDLWAFLVQYPSQAELKQHQADLKDLLRRALPLFGRLTQDGTLTQVSVATPVGPIAARALATHVDTTGLTSEGSAALAVKADDLVLPTAVLPPWTAALIPTALDLHDSLAGYGLDRAATAVIDGLDLGAPQPLSPDALDKVRAALGPRDALVVKLGDNRITTPTLGVMFSGEVRLASQPPAFKVAVRATGVDKAIGAVQAEAAHDPTAAQAIAVLTLIKGYGKGEGSDKYSWDLAGDGTGALTVNGVPLPIGAPK